MFWNHYFRISVWFNQYFQSILIFKPELIEQIGIE